MITFKPAISGDCYAYLQDAIDEMMESGDDENALLLHGNYSLSHGLVIDDELSGSTGPCVSIAGLGGPTLTYTGATTTDYLLKFEQNKQPHIPRLTGVRVDCDSKCRGVLFLRQTGMAVVTDRLWVTNSWQVGVDVVNCWSSNFNQIYIGGDFPVNYRGIGLRVTRGNAVWFNNIHMSNGWGMWHTSGGAGDRQAMILYEMEHGEDLTKELYGDAYLDCYPAVDDATVMDYQSNYVQTAENERAAAIVINNTCRNNRFQNVVIQGCRGGDKPLISAQHTNWGLRMSQLYLENNYTRLAKVLVRGGTNGLTAGGTSMYRFDQITSQDEVTDYDTLSCDAFLRLEGRTSQMSVTNLIGHAYDHIVRAADGVHQKITIEDIRTYGRSSDGPYEDMTEEDWLAVTEGAEVLDDAQVDRKIQSQAEQDA